MQDQSSCRERRRWYRRVHSAPEIGEVVWGSIRERPIGPRHRPASCPRRGKRRRWGRQERRIAAAVPGPHDGALQRGARLLVHLADDP
jgi:hypothetical protein